MSDDFKNYFDQHFFKSYNPEKHLYKQAESSIEKDDLAGAIQFLESILLINPKNIQAKQRLLEIYPKAIQDVIDEGRYEDASSLVQSAIKLELKTKQLLLLKLKIFGLQFISKYYPDEELIFGTFWDALKDINEIKIKRNMVTNTGLAFTGTGGRRRDASLYIAASILDFAKNVEQNDVIESQEHINKNLLHFVRKHKTPKQIVNSFIDFIESQDK